MPTVRLTTCNDAVTANFMRTKLEDSGIPCFLTNENSSTLIPHHNVMLNGGVQVMVLDANVEEARELLKLDARDTLCCPACGSTQLKMSFGEHKVKKIFAIFLGMLTATPSPQMKNDWTCKECNTSF